MALVNSLQAALLVGASGFCLVYLVCLVVWRLLLSPIARFPGPRLAALSNWYEFYYDVILQGQFTPHVQELHKKYGPIVRITPTELHIDDPDYFDTLYARSGGARRDKYAYFAGRFGYAGDSFSTIHHDLHRMRRKAISPFFSAAKIAEFQPVIRAKVDKLCEKLAEYVDEGSKESKEESGESKDGGPPGVVSLSRAWMALTTDIITEYAFAKSYDHLESPGFRDTMHEALVAIYTTGHFALHFPIVFPILDRLPEWFVRANQPAIIPVVGLRKDLAKRIREIADGINQGHKEVGHPTIFHELLHSDLPAAEKTDARLGDEAQLIVAAGLITTSWSLAVASFHLIRHPEVAARLRAEVLAASGSGGRPETLDWHALERLPYLDGCVHEAIRLSHGIVTRDPRLAPDDELRYGDWTIPRNTPVSMTTYDILMNADIFPDPETFRPERWIEDPGLERYFVPFGKGSRQCLGINLAMAELYITLATVFSRFEFELFETDESDVRMAHAYLVPYPKWESKGIRGRVKAKLQ